MDDIAKRVSNLSPTKRTLLELKLRKKAAPKSLGGESTVDDIAKRVANLSLTKRALLELKLRKKAAPKDLGGESTIDDIAKRVANLSLTKRTLLELKLRKKIAVKSSGSKPATNLAKQIANLSPAKRALLELRLKEKATTKSSKGEPEADDILQQIANLSPAKRALLKFRLTKKRDGISNLIVSPSPAATPETEAPEEFITAEPAAEMPEWLGELPDVDEDTPTAEIEAAADEEIEMPEWLGELPDVDEDTPTAEIEAAAEGEMEMPEWLGELPDVEEDTPTAEIEAAAEGEIEMPEWLGELPDVDEDTPTAEIEAAADEEIEMPEWLGELPDVDEDTPTAEIEAADVLVATPPDPQAVSTTDEVSDGLTDVLAEEPETPAWLLEDDISDDEAVAIQAPPEVIEPFEAEAEPPTPDWLIGMEEATEDVDAVSPTDSGILDFDEDPGLPDWLSDIEDPDALFGEVQIDLSTASSPVVEASPVPSSPSPATTGKSSWVESLRPTTEEAVTDDGDNKTAEDTGMLSGISTLLPAERIAVPTREAGSLAEAAQEFYKIATEAPQPATLPTPLTRGEKAVGGVVRSVLYLLFIALIALPLLPGTGRMVNNLLVPWSEPTGDDGEVLDSQRRELISEQLGIIDLQQPGSVALVSFDYSAATQGEMQPLAEAIIGRLKGQGMRLIAVSLEPEGATIAQNTLDGILTGDEEQIEKYGVEVINLGYLPGQMAAIRALVTGQEVLSTIPDYRENRALNARSEWDGIQNLEQVDIVVTFADNPTTVRWWIEQLEAAPQPANGNRCLLAATSAIADPFLRPYRGDDSASDCGKQLDGLVSGVNGAATIEAVRNRFGSARQMIDSIGIATIIIVILIVAGTIIGWMPSQIPESDVSESKNEPVESVTNKENG